MLISYHIVDFVQQETKFTMEQVYMLPILYMPVDALATKGARAPAGIVLTK